MAGGEGLERDLAALSAVLRDRDLPPEPPGDPRLRELFDALAEIRRFTLSLSAGDLSQPLPARSFVAASLKQLQSSLRHLVWQARQVAQGDYSQRLEFLGEFSDAFNQMVERMDDTVTRLQVREAELRSLSSTDPLTGTNNRRRFLDLLGEEVERSSRYGRPLSILMIDLDHFKDVNDTRGHAAGDEALRSVTGAVARSGLRAVDFLGRLGGEEFAVALPETRCSEAMVVAERIRRVVEDTVIPSDEIGFRVTVSIGVTEHDPGEPQDLLLRRADEALYEAKRSGRNRVRSR